MKNILIYGKGKSGKAVAKLFDGCSVYFYDDKCITKNDLTLRDAQNLVAEMDLMIISPGISFDSPLCSFYEENGVPIKSELEIAVSFFGGKIAAVTGTNGKTTVCRMLYEILCESGIKAVLAGNVGTPFSQICQNADKNTVAVIEASSFQLERFYGFQPFLSAVTNVSPDHLDRHKNMEGYIKAKQNVCKYQTAFQHTVLNFGDKIIRDNFVSFAAQKHYFGFSNTLDCYIDKGDIVCWKNRIELNKNNNLPHIQENMMCAALSASILGANQKAIENSLNNYIPAKHRIEFVAKEAGVSFFDDSKATNVFSAIASVNSFSDAFVIMGGSDKGYDFEEFFEKCSPKYICAFGATKKKIYDAAMRCGFYNIDLADDLKQATENCYRQALIDGGTVLLAPACASFDMYNDYKQRGEAFVEIVKNIVKKKLL
ncbi:MAG TPA: UDP-N-acetylmuramoyl-L-alanine--D-glutamate ligase [Clostridia bacterium]|nr:UDP-N-acetylmuramoyl-L-alanine--D-glutamate ligase [Clostridia bacterium]